VDDGSEHQQPVDSGVEHLDVILGAEAGAAATSKPLLSSLLNRSWCLLTRSATFSVIPQVSGVCRARLARPTGLAEKALRSSAEPASTR